MQFFSRLPLFGKFSEMIIICAIIWIMKDPFPKGKCFPPFLQSSLFVPTHSLRDRESILLPSSISILFSTGDGAEVNDTLIGIFFKARKTLNRGCQQEISHYHVIVVFNLKAPYIQAVMLVYCVLTDEMRVLMAIASFHQPAWMGRLCGLWLKSIS